MIIIRLLKKLSEHEVWQQLKVEIKLAFLHLNKFEIREQFEFEI